jgi:hypothetical protein
MKEINAYGCEYCHMVSRIKSSVVRHEKKSCRKNPNRKTCGSCVNMFYEAGYSEILDYGQSRYEPSFWYCEIKEIDLENQNLNKDINCEYFSLKNLTE